MKNLLRSTDRIMITLALMGSDTLEAYIKGHGVGWTHDFASSLKINDAAFRKSISRLLSSGDIEKVTFSKGQNAYRLGAKGQERFQKLYPLSKLNIKPWDGFWRVVIFDTKQISKNKREHLRKKLAGLGFGKLQESCYVNPLNIISELKEYLARENLFGQVIVFEVKEMLGINAKGIASLVWNLDKINDGYMDLIDEARDLRDTDLVEEESALKRKLFNLLIKDPILPRELLPSEWLRDRARKVILHL